MIAMTSGVSPRGIDTYNIPPTMVNQQMSLPIIKSDLNDSDPKVLIFFFFFINYFIIIFHLFKRKRGRPPKTKSDGPTPVAPYIKHPLMNPTGLSLTPTINNQVILNDQHGKVYYQFLKDFTKRFFFCRMIHIKVLLCDHHVVLI
jgi:hypothetical protein